MHCVAKQLFCIFIYTEREERKCAAFDAVPASYRKHSAHRMTLAAIVVRIENGYPTGLHTQQAAHAHTY